MSKMLNEKVINVDKLTDGIYKLTFVSSYIAENAKPGQFVNVKCQDGYNALLRRPISICDVDFKNRTVDIVFRVKGTGTEILAQKKEGDTIDLIGPIGKCFDFETKYEEMVVVGGGIGIFPFLYLLKKSNARVKKAYLGFRNKSEIILKENFETLTDELHIATDDGSYGYKGFVHHMLNENIKSSIPEIIYTCGPTPMMKEVVKISEIANTKCQVSMEQRMGCGIGACLVCACKTKSGDDFDYSHVCKDGPVFWAQDLVLK